MGMDRYTEEGIQAGLKMHEDLGRYVAEARKIGARMSLEVDLTGFDMANKSGHDRYTGSVLFYAKGREDSEFPVVDVKIDTFDLRETFRKLKRAEEGIEELFRDELEGGYDWKAARKVMRCVLSLEDQLKPVIENRKKQAEERREKMKS